jgi:hypothetical protein
MVKSNSIECKPYILSIAIHHYWIVIDYSVVYMREKASSAKKNRPLVRHTLNPIVALMLPWRALNLIIALLLKYKHCRLDRWDPIPLKVCPAHH